MANSNNTRSQKDDGAQEAPIFLLDTNAIQSFLGKQTRPLLEPLLQEVSETGGILAVSDIVLYEVLKAIVFNPDKVRPVAHFIDNSLTRYPVDDTVLVAAARVHEIYGSEQATKKHRSTFSTEDIIIGTTAMLVGGYIMTSDCNDYPAPFFKEVNRQVLFYDDGDRRRHLIMHLLQPDQEVVNSAIAQLLKPIKNK